MASRGIGARIRVLRAARDMTQTELAKRAGIKRQTLSAYEHDEVAPDAVSLHKILKELRVGFGALDFAGAFLDLLEADGAETCPEMPRGQQEWLRSLSALIGQSTARSSYEILAPLVAGREPEIEMGGTVELAVPPCPLGPTPEDRRDAPALWERLKGLSSRKQRQLVAADPALWNWSLCELLCKESAVLASSKPAKALLMAELALHLASKVSGTPAWRSKLIGFAWAFIGNARRVQGDLIAADSAFGEAGKYWQAGQDDPSNLLEWERILDLKASLRRAQRRLPEALELIEEALQTASTLVTRLRLLVKKAKTLEETGEWEQATAELRAAEASLEEVREPRLELCVHHNLVWLLTNLEMYKEAQARLPLARVLSREIGSDLDRLRLRWVEARLAAESGDPEKGLAEFIHIRGEFVRRRMLYDTALVSVELAALYADFGRHREVKDLARHMVPIFRSQNVHREALAALSLFRRAAEREVVTRAFARKLLLYLHKARHNSALRFQE